MLMRGALGAFFALAFAWTAQAQNNFPTPGGATVPGYVTMCISGNIAVPCNPGGGASGGVVAGSVNTGCPVNAILFNTAGNVIGCDASLTYGGAGGQTIFGGTGTVAAPTIAFSNGGSNNVGFYNQLNQISVAVIGATPVAFQAGGVAMAMGTVLSWADVQLRRQAPAVMQMGTTDSAAPGAFTFGTQNGAGTNISGANFTVRGSTSTGTGIAGDLNFQTGGTGAGAAVQNAFITGLAVKGASQLVVFPVITSDATHTTATLCEDTTSHGAYFGSGTAGICLGTSGRQFKRDIEPMGAVLDDFMKLDFVTFRYRDGYGDNGARRQSGLIAQDVEKVFPALVGHNDNGETINYDFGAVVVMYGKMIQELKTANDNLRVEVETLKAKVR